jgi:hypothetical protein
VGPLTPVDQTAFYEPAAPPDKQRGNCLTAVVASLLDLPIGAVPNFVQDHVDHDADNDDEWNWWTRLHRFISEHDHVMRYLRNVEHPEPFAASDDGFPDPEPGECYTVSGISPRDARIHHIVIYRDGEMVHDPHPDRTGVVTVTDQYHWTLRRLEGGES